MAGKLGEERQGEGSGLAGPRLGAANQVPCFAPDNWTDVCNSGLETDTNRKCNVCGRNGQLPCWMGCKPGFEAIYDYTTKAYKCVTVTTPPPPPNTATTLQRPFGRS